MVAAAHETGHLVVGLRRGWLANRMWLGIVNHVHFAQDGIPIPTASVIAVCAAGPLAGAVVGTAAAGVWLADAGPLTATVALAIGVGRAVSRSSSSVAMASACRAVSGHVRAAVRTVVLDPGSGLRAAPATA